MLSTRRTLLAADVVARSELPASVRLLGADGHDLLSVVVFFKQLLYFLAGAGAGGKTDGASDDNLMARRNSERMTAFFVVIGCEDISSMIILH